MALPAELYQLSTESQIQSFCDLVQTFAHMLAPDIVFLARYSVLAHAVHGHSLESLPDHEAVIPVVSPHLTYGSSSTSLFVKPDLHIDGIAPADDMDLAAAGADDGRGAAKPLNAIACTGPPHRLAHSIFRRSSTS